MVVKRKERFIYTYKYVNKRKYTYKMKKGNEKLTLSVNKAVKDNYKKFCEEEGLKLSRQIEKFMSDELKRRK